MPKKLKPKQWERKETPPREVTVIEKEYNDTALALGITTYQVEALKGRQIQLQNRIHELVQENQKAVEAKKTEDAKSSQS